MSLMDDVKQFVGKFVANPIKTTIVAYLIWKILKPHSESLASFGDIKVLKRDGDRELVYDTKMGIYAVITGTDIIYFSKKEDALKYFDEGEIKMKKLESIHRQMFREGIKDRIDYRHIGGGLTLGGPFEGFSHDPGFKASIGHYSGGRSGYFVAKDVDITGNWHDEYDSIEREFAAAISEIEDAARDYEREIIAIMKKHGFEPE